MGNLQTKDGVKVSDLGTTMLATNDHFLIAVLVTIGFKARLLMDDDGSVFAEFIKDPELTEALRRFESNELCINAWDCDETYRELMWRIQEKDVEQANEWPAQNKSR